MNMVEKYKYFQQNKLERPINVFQKSLVYNKKNLSRSILSELNHFMLLNFQPRCKHDQAATPISSLGPTPSPLDSPTAYTLCITCLGSSLGFSTSSM